MARRKIKLVDLCKVNTDTFRHMTREQLARVERSTGSFFDFNQAERTRADGYGVPKKIERKSRHNNAILAKFVRVLKNLRGDDNSPAHIEWHRKEYGKPPGPPDPDLVKFDKKTADRIERAIWDLQARLACPIKPRELVARDAAREGRPELVAKIRGKAHIK